jgi:hypothetical protein
MGDGTSYVDEHDYANMVGEVISNLTAHEAIELLCLVAVTDPAVFAYALSHTGVCYCA